MRCEIRPFGAATLASRATARVASFEVLEDRTLLAADFDGGLLFGTPQRIASEVGGGPAIGDLSNFGGAVASLGDLNSDGVADLVVGAAGDRRPE